MKLTLSFEAVNQERNLKRKLLGRGDKTFVKQEILQYTLNRASALFNKR
ncbi:hypothetical protein UF75_2437 [Desulfosporosinus sp. I2]|nr:hypothetical protein UF75_2437 [Desulfosporosinus sp. I2]